jgi:FAD/FMN-containing dehydrogenase
MGYLRYSDVFKNRDRIKELRNSIQGQVILPGEDNYEESRKVWNGMIERRPEAIIRCKGNRDVIQAVNFARGNQLLVSVKGGGHNVAGNAVCEGGVMIDLSLMRSARVDKEKKTVRVDGGCLLSDMDQETQAYGLAVPAGIVSHTGVGGLTLGGGFGWISRKYGLSVDNLLSADLVTADGELLSASGEENPDLFWAIRGGGGNFGVVTSLEFRCAHIGTEVFAGIIVHSFENAKDYIQFHRDYVRSLPDDMTVWMVIRHAPPLPFLPEEVHGRLIVAVPFVYLGEGKEGERLIKPLEQFATPYGSMMGMIPWRDWQTGFDALNSHFARNYWKSHHLEDLSDKCIESLLSFAGRFPTPSCEVFIPHMEGAPSRVSATETAYAFRTAPFILNIHARWEEAEQDSGCITWARDFFEETKPFAKGVYVNFLSDEGEARVREAYPEDTWNRLVEVKNRYDPTNFFSMNQNIKPTL